MIRRKSTFTEARKGKMTTRQLKEGISRNFFRMGEDDGDDEDMEFEGDEPAEDEGASDMVTINLDDGSSITVARAAVEAALGGDEPAEDDFADEDAEDEDLGEDEELAEGEDEESDDEESDDEESDDEDDSEEDKDLAEARARIARRKAIREARARIARRKAIAEAKAKIARRKAITEARSARAKAPARKAR